MRFLSHRFREILWMKRSKYIHIKSVQDINSSNSSMWIFPKCSSFWGSHFEVHWHFFCYSGSNDMVLFRGFPLSSFYAVTGKSVSKIEEDEQKFSWWIRSAFFKIVFFFTSSLSLVIRLFQVWVGDVEHVSEMAYFLATEQERKLVK